MMRKAIRNFSEALKRESFCGDKSGMLRKNSGFGQSASMHQKKVSNGKEGDGTQSITRSGRSHLKEKRSYDKFGGCRIMLKSLSRGEVLRQA